MKRLKIILTLCLFTVLILIPSSKIKATSESISKDSNFFSSAAPSAQQVNELWNSNNVARNSLPFHLKGLLSGDSKTAELELQEEYIKQFDVTKKMVVINEKQAAQFLGINIPFTEHIDFFHHLTNAIKTIIEVLEQLFSWITTIIMSMYTLAVNNFFGRIIGDLFEYVNTSLLGVGKLDSLITRIMIAIAVVAGINTILRNSRRGKTFSPKNIFYQVFAQVINVGLVFLLISNGPNMINQFNKEGANFFGSIVTSSEVSTEIQTKRILFDLLQKTPFYYRHFEIVDDASQTIFSSKDEYISVCSQSVFTALESSIDMSKFQSSQDMVKSLFIDACNKKAENVNFETLKDKKPLQEFLKTPTESKLVEIQSSTFVTVPSKNNIGGRLGDSAIFGIFRIILGGVLFLVCVFYIVIGILYTSTLYLSTYSLIFAVSHPEKGPINWFINRLFWMVFYSISTISFTIIILMITKIVKLLIGIHILFLFAFSLILIMLLFQLIKHPEILKGLFKSIWNTFVDGALHGKFTPQEMIVQSGKTIMRDGKVQLNKLFNQGNIDQENITAHKAADTLYDDTLSNSHLREEYNNPGLSEYLRKMGVTEDNRETLRNEPVTTSQKSALNDSYNFVRSGDQRFYRVPNRENVYKAENKLDAIEVIAYLYGITDIEPTHLKQKVEEKVNVEQPTDEVNQNIHVENQHHAEHEIHASVIENSSNLKEETIITENYPESSSTPISIENTMNLNTIEKNSALQSTSLSENVDLTKVLADLNQSYKQYKDVEFSSEKEALQKMIEASRELFKEHRKEEITIEVYKQKMQEKGIGNEIMTQFNALSESKSQE